MKWTRKGWAILMTLAMLVFTCASPALAVDYHTEEHELWAGAGDRWEVGMVYVTQSDGQICVRIELNQDTIDDGFRMTSVYYAYGLSPYENSEDHNRPASNDIPTKNGNPIPGKFPYKYEFEPGETEHTFCFENIWEPTKFIDIATHVVIERPEGPECPYQTETCWSDCHHFPGSNWAKYIHYEIYHEPA